MRVMMHHGARGALAVDDELAKLGDRFVSRFQCRFNDGHVSQYF
jgi:hypothetical protein